MNELLLAGILIVEIMRLLETPHWSGVWRQMKFDARNNLRNYAIVLRSKLQRKKEL
jgi:hypothetical protein